MTETRCIDWKHFSLAFNLGNYSLSGIDFFWIETKVKEEGEGEKKCADTTQLELSALNGADVWNVEEKTRAFHIWSSRIPWRTDMPKWLVFFCQTHCGLSLEVWYFQRLIDACIYVINIIQTKGLFAVLNITLSFPSRNTTVYFKQGEWEAE